MIPLSLCQPIRFAYICPVLLRYSEELSRLVSEQESRIQAVQSELDRLYGGVSVTPAARVPATPTTATTVMATPKCYCFYPRLCFVMISILIIDHARNVC